MKFIALLLLLTPSLLAQLLPGNEKGLAMGHIHLLVSDIEAHKKLWVDALGAKVVKAGPLELYEFPGVQVALRKGTPTGGNQGTVLDHLGFKVKDLAATKAKITAGGASIMSENPGTGQMMVLFPDAVKIEFTEDKSLQQPVVHHHIHFATPQIEEQRTWYEKTFGAKLGMSGRFKAADIPGVDIRWNASEKALPGTKGCSVDHIGFEVVNLEAFCRKLEADGIKFDMAFRSVPQLGLSIAFLTDPWGVYIELTEGLARVR
ncbi:MAG TPA: VOC family protein [Verrucomicrobiae bacterium]|jgi:catechol 2,3-dioxygenase-like lactoylglutathione lyase family enzyme|nr:VOC family protein [Verrucomicrobiae bacterium]